MFDLFETNCIQKTPLNLREHKKNGFFLENVKIIPCTELKFACKVLDVALKSRQTGSHDINSRSSRSHFITDIFIELPGRLEEAYNKKGAAGGAGGAEGGAAYPDQKEYTTVGRATLVDLAGSERLKDTKSRGKVLTETGFINKSLYVLGKMSGGEWRLCICLYP